MVFSSETFLFLFLPVFLGAYYLTPFRWKSLTILLFSWGFYGWWRIDFLGLLIGTTLFTYLVGIRIGRAPQGSPQARLWLAIGVTGCLLVLGTFKYLNFFIDSLAWSLGTTPADMGIHWRLILPIGISFYIFQSLSYLIDVYRRDVPPTTRFLDFAAFIALFPQLIAGPILRFKDLADQFTDRRHSPQLFADGFALFLLGLAKKVLLADTVAPLADLAFTTPDPSFLLAWLGTAAYTLQLYFDFSGYSDMACGLGLMIGFRFINNFDTPYISRSITEFWRRWHISLSVWLRDYLYIPLGGNRLGTTRTYANLMTVMVLGGLWHGANWTFLLWGAWHGGWLALERATGLSRDRSATGLARTLLLVMLGWVAFRAATVTDAFGVYAGLAGFNGFGLSPDLALAISGEALLFLGLGFLAATAEPVMRANLQRAWFTSHPDGTLSASRSLLPTLGLAALATLSIMKLAEQSFSPFLYFQF